MIRISQYAAILAAAAALCACKPREETPNTETAAAEEESAPAAAPTLALLDACKIRMSQPEAHEWDTKWNPAHIQTAGENPSGIRSTHWADENELKAAREMGTVIPLDLVCGNGDGEKPEIKFGITAFDSSMTDVPL
ncbi:MAG: hypothetical protein ABUL69_03180, partial [Peristeroidobacter soli]